MTLTTYTDVHAHYHANKLLVAGIDQDALAKSLASARVDMNPHQVDAALFALKSPLSKGVLLADEVGLGKTIEAGLVIMQRWAERRRRILLVVPASLRKQWQGELRSKFAIPSVILEAKTYVDLKKQGIPRPFEIDAAVVITSYEFAARKAEDVAHADWDLVVFDEAHKMRNVHKPGGGKTAKALKAAVASRFKILLTATPLQNSLSELYGITSIIDDQLFGGEAAFRANYMGAGAGPASLSLLRERLLPVCHRTLRRQVQEAGHINFKRRHAVTFSFEPHDREVELYERASAYLQNNDTIAYGGRSNALVVLQARKMLGSSTAAVAGYLDALLKRLKDVKLPTVDMTDDLEDVLVEDHEDDATDEIDDGSTVSIDPQKLAREITEVADMRDLAHAIGVNAKGEKLIAQLPVVFDEIAAKGGARKAVIFTESVRTQRYLHGLLSANGYADQIVLMNGNNNDDESKDLLAAWRDRKRADDDQARNQGLKVESALSGSRTADMKQAIVDAFTGPEKSILIATESGAEGINLQFCSLLINYDLPWNPQRIEQRIGRCHRYGQKVDVTVVNMLNLKNQAEARIHQLLEQKLKLFDGVFGASDEVLGLLADGIDFEREVLAIVQKARTADEAEAQFAELEDRLKTSIDAAVADARAKVLENMDATVVANLQRRGQALASALPEFERRLLIVARAALPTAVFAERGGNVFDYDGRTWTTKWPIADENDWAFFRVNEGLGAEIVQRERVTAPAERSLVFDPAAYPFPGQLGGVAALAGKAGWLRVLRATVGSDAPREEVLIAAMTDEGAGVDSAIADKLLMAPAMPVPLDGDVPSGRLDIMQQEAFAAFTNRVEDDNHKWLLEKQVQLDAYADDREADIQTRIKEIDGDLKGLRRQRSMGTMEERVATSREINRLDGERDELMMTRHQEKKRIRSEVDEALDRFAATLKNQPRCEMLFDLRWRVI